MEAVLVGALTGSAFTAFGWLANHYLTLRRAERAHVLQRQGTVATQRLLASIRHVEAQLSELYGPLVFQLQEGEKAFDELLTSLGRTYLFDIDNTVPGEDLDTWLFWVDNFFLPSNATICELLRTKAHLVEGPNLPDSYRAFIDYFYSWKVHHDRWKVDGVEYRWRARENWPTTFSEDVEATFNMLKARHAAFLADLGQGDHRGTDIR